MTKDRLGEFKKKRLYGSFRGSLRRVVKPLGHDDDDEAMAPVLALAKEVQADLDAMQQQVDELKKLYSDTITSPFAAPTALEKAENMDMEIRQAAGGVKQKLTKIDPKPPKLPPNNSNNLLKPLENNSLQVPGQEQNQAEQEPEGDGNLARNKPGAVVRLCKTHHVLLSTRLAAILQEMNAAEVAFRNDSRARLRRQMSIAGHGRVTEQELENKVDDNLQGNFAVFTHDIVTDVDAARSRKEELKECLERDKCLMSLEHSIKEMHTIFQDVALLVGRQGEVVDSIQHHVQRTASYVEQGKNDLARARLMRKRHGKRKLFLLGFLAVLVIVVSVVIVIIVVLAA